jgi:DNA modification methylase
MKQYTLLHGDCLELLKTMPDNSVDSIVTDPPYELGFMGKKWDSTGIAYSVEMWSECLRVLNHGGHLLAFGGTRTYHRMACAIEDAGFEVRDMIEWVYGSGFPKSLNIGKAVDKLQGNDSEEKDVTFPDGSKPRKTAGNFTVGKYSPRDTKYTKGNSEWEGWGTALKPAHEPVCMARKPLAEKTVAENVLKYGTGGINIDESRVATSEKIAFGKTKEKAPDANCYGKYNLRIGDNQNEQGRFPANLIHDNSEEVRECFPETGKSVSSKRGADRNGDVYGTYNLCDTVRGHDDNGGNASRFFKSIIYAAKASKADRGNGNTHATVKPTALMAYLIKMVTRQGGIVLDPFMGSGTTAVAAVRHGFGFIGIEKESDHFEICKARIERDVKQQCERGELDLPHKQLTLF